MTSETVTVICARHNRRVVTGPAGGNGPVILHEAPARGNVERACDSERFTVRRKRTVDRGTAHAEMLDLARKAQEN